MLDGDGKSDAFEDGGDGEAKATTDLGIAAGDGEVVDGSRGQSKGCAHSEGNAGTSEQYKCHHNCKNKGLHCLIFKRFERTFMEELRVIMAMTKSIE